MEVSVALDAQDLSLSLCLGLSGAGLCLGLYPAGLSLGLSFAGLCLGPGLGPPGLGRPGIDNITGLNNTKYHGI